MSIELVMPSNHLILCHPLLLSLFNLSQHHSLFKWVSSSHQVAKVLAFQLQHQVMLGVMAVMGAPSKWLIPANPKAPRLLYSVPLTSGRPLLTHTSPLLETPGLSWASLGQPLVGSLLLFPGSWCAQGFVCALQESVSPVLCKFWVLYGGVNGDLLQEGLCHTQVCCTHSPWPCGRPLLTGTHSSYTKKIIVVYLNPN